MWKPWTILAGWPSASNARAVANARAAATACARRRVERADVDSFLAEVAAARRSVRETRHPA